MRKDRFEELKQSIVDAGRIKRGEIPASRVFEGDTETGEIVQLDPRKVQHQYAKERAARTAEVSRQRSRRSAA